MLKKIVRIEQWWSHILPPILMFYYIGLFKGNISIKNTFINALLLILVSIIIAFIGYFINDLFDIKDDLKANKKNYVSQFPTWLKLATIPIVLTLLFLIFLIFKSQVSITQLKCYIFCMTANLIAFIIYSTPPIRFKKVVYISSIVDALYSGTFFYVLAYSITTLDSLNLELTKSTKIIYLAIFCYGFLKGIRNHLSHLCEDELNDKQSGITTLATKFGNEKIQTIANLFFPFEIICLLIIQFYLVKPAIISISFTCLFFLVWIKFMIKNKNIKHEILNDLHEVWLPILILCLLIISQHQLYFLVIIHFLFFPYHISKIYFTIKNGIFKLLNKEPVSIKELLNGK